MCIRDSLYSANKIKFTTKLKKGQTYVFVIDNSGSVFPDTPYNDSFYDGSMLSLIHISP